MFSTPIIDKILDGQDFKFNTQSKVVILVLRKKLTNASGCYGWPESFSSDAFGINSSIVKFVIMAKSKLLINYETQDTKTEYWISFDTLRDFIKRHKNEFNHSSGVIINNIPCSLFKPKPIFSGEKLTQ